MQFYQSNFRSELNVFKSQREIRYSIAYLLQKVIWIYIPPPWATSKP